MEVPTWQQIIILSMIFVLIMVIRYWMIEKSKENKENRDFNEKKKIIKEILELLKKYPHLFSHGLCIFMIRLKNKEIISENEYIIYRKFIEDNSPYKLFPKEFPIIRAYWFYHTDINKSIQVRIDYLKRLLNE